MYFWLMFLACSDTEKPTDPNLDSDGDGYTDLQEEDAGTNPQSAYSYPLEQGEYNIGLCENGIEPSSGPSVQASIEEGGGIDWSHYAQGDVVEDIVLKDQYGQDVSLYQFCGQHIMLVIGSFT